MISLVVICHQIQAAQDGTTEDQVRIEMLRHPWSESPPANDMCFPESYCDEARETAKKIEFGEYNVVKPLGQFGSSRSALLSHLKMVSGCKNTQFLNIYAQNPTPKLPSPPPYYMSQDLVLYPVGTDGSLFLVRADGFLPSQPGFERRVYFLVDAKRCLADNVIGVDAPPKLNDGSLEFDSPISIDTVSYIVGSYRYPRLYYPGQYLYFFVFIKINKNWNGQKSWVFEETYNVVRPF
jgi:hypothetical protein